MNWDLVGYDWAVRLLKGHIVHNNLRHAYLFCGPRGTSRRTLALRLAQAINCTNPREPGEPCLECSTCQRIGRRQHPDLTVLQAEQEGGTIKVEQVREMQPRLSLAPYEARYRVALLLRFEEANQSAANALLKTLEEPPPQVILLLTAESPESVLPTIVSRCEVLRLSPLPIATATHALQERWQAPADQAKRLAHLSGGRMGYAAGLLSQPEVIEKRQAWLEDLHRLLSASRVQRFAYAETVSKSKENTREILLVWLSFWRDILLRAAGSEAPLTNLDLESDVDELASRFSLETAHQAVRAVERTIEMLEKNANTRLALEVLLLDFPKL